MGSVTRHDNRRLSRASRHSWQSGSALLPAYVRTRRSVDSFGRLIIFLHPLWTDYVRQAGRHGCSNNCLFLPLPVRSLIPARAEPSGERCDAPLCNGRNLHGASVRLPFLPSRRACGPYKSRRSNKWFASQRPCAMQRCLLVRVHRCRRLLLKSGDSAKINRFATRICEQGSWTRTGEGLTDPVHVRHLHR